MGVRPLGKRFPQALEPDFTIAQRAESLAPDIRLLADKEGLSAHRQSVDLRLADDRQPGSNS